MKSRRELPALYYPDNMRQTRIINPYRYAAGGGGTGLLTSLIHWYDGAETSGNLTDGVGSLNGTVNGGATYTASAAPDGGNARYFDGTDDYFSFGSLDLSAYSGVTLAGWFRHPNTNGFLFFHDSYGTNQTTYLRSGLSDDSQLYVPLSGSAAISVDTSDNSSTDNVWHSWVVTGGDGAAKMYLDGTLAITHSRDFPLVSAGFYVGADRSGNTRWAGEMCSLGIWSAVLSSGLIAAFHNSGTNLRLADL